MYAANGYPGGTEQLEVALLPTEISNLIESTQHLIMVLMLIFDNNDTTLIILQKLKACYNQAAFDSRRYGFSVPWKIHHHIGGYK